MVPQPSLGRANKSDAPAEPAGGSPVTPQIARYQQLRGYVTPPLRRRTITANLPRVS